MTISLRSRHWKGLTVVLMMTFAAIQFVRSYFFINAPYLDEGRYESGSERMPYQGRILMAYIIRGADRISLVTRTASHLRGPLHDPSTLVIAIVGLVSLLATALVLHRWYLLLSPARLFPWLPFALCLWMSYATYLARFQEAIYFPYDLLSLALFTLALFLCFRENYLLLALVYLVSCFNRETIVVLLLPLGLNAWLHLRATPRRIPVKEVVLFFLFVGLSFEIHGHYSHVFAHNPDEMHERLRENLGFLESPQTWSQILSGAGFLLPVPFLWFRLMPSLRMRLYSSLLPVWVAAMFFFGLLPESRVFGEMIGFLSVYCALQFESFVRPSSSVPSA